MKKPTARTVPALLAEMVARAPGAPFLVGENARLSYAEFADAVTLAARALSALGIGVRDRVGILMGNRPEWLIIDFAVMSLGAIAVGLNTWATPHELVYQLDHAGVKLLVIEPRFRATDLATLVGAARALGHGLPTLKTVVWVGDEAPSGMLSYQDLLAQAVSVPALVVSTASAEITAHDVACLLYTSGSTALPKGVPLLHGGLIDNMWEIGERQQLVADDRLWLAVSLFWSLACVNAIFAVTTHGASIVLQHSFDASEALRLIEAERCTVFYGTPNMALAMWEHPDRVRRDLSTLRTGVTIGTPAQVQRVAALGAHAICNVYGLTEAYGNSAVTAASDPLARRAQTVGRALPGVEIIILDRTDGRPLPAGEVGEIALRGNVTPGYWDDPVRTAEVFTPEGFFRTGDLGLLDDDGYLYYRGRLKEMVKTGGINVAPAEVEEILAAHPAVELAFVTGVPDARLDEALAAVIVLRSGTSTTAEELALHCRATLAAYKTPRRFRFVQATELPLTTTGKLQRNRLPELFAAGDEA